MDRKKDRKQGEKQRKIRLNWRFEGLSHVSEVRMRDLYAFYLHTREHFATTMQAWEQEAEGITDEDSFPAYELDERRHQIESLLDRQHMLGIVGLYTFLETHMNLVIEQLRTGGATITESKRGFNLHQLSKHLRSVGIDIKKKPFDWQALNQIREVRNCIAHADGWVTEEFAERLRSVDLTVHIDTQLLLAENYFERSWKLVDATYRRIDDECSKKFLVVPV